MCPLNIHLSRIPITLHSATLNPSCMAAPRILRKFPFNLGIGTDICHVVRIESILKSHRGIRFVQKILRPDERSHPKIQWLLKSQSQPVLSFQDERIRPTASSSGAERRKMNDEHGGPKSAHNIQTAATFIAGRYGVLHFIIMKRATDFACISRFAAKEAVIKAHPHRALTWHDITIQSPAVGAYPGRNGAPFAIIRGEDKGGDADPEDREALVSISHDGEYATAVCLGAGDSM